MKIFTLSVITIGLMMCQVQAQTIPFYKQIGDGYSDSGRECMCTGLPYMEM